MVTSGTQTKQTKQTSSWLDHGKWKDGSLGVTHEKHGRSPWLAHTTKLAEHPKQIFQTSVWLQGWTAGLGDSRTRVEHTASKCHSALPALGQPSAQRKVFYPGDCRNWNTFQAAAPPLHPHDLLVQNWFPRTPELGFVVVVLRFFFFLSWFTLYSQDVIKVQSEERRRTSSVSVISSTSC